MPSLLPFCWRRRLLAPAMAPAVKGDVEVGWWWLEVMRWCCGGGGEKPYLDRVVELKAKYEKAMEIYNATEKEVLLFVPDQEESPDKSDTEGFS
ncbi:hypothetical protein P8452_52586 [Trifolium repens]|nr:hypothetical protein P8452_52586 [Trifolium repens]